MISIETLKENYLYPVISSIINNKSFRILPEYSQYKIYESGIIRDIKTDEIVPMTYSINSPYFHVKLKNDATGKLDNCSIHRLVAKAFIQNNIKNLVVHHINQIKTDNRIDNLKIMDPIEHITLHGKIQEYNDPILIHTVNALVYNELYMILPINDNDNKNINDIKL